MSSKALSKKTFGIENETWIFSSGFIYCLTSIIRFVLIAVDSNLGGGSYNEYDDVLGFYILLSTVCIVTGSLFLFSTCVAPEHYRKLFIGKLIYSFFLTFYFFNPFIFEYLPFAKNTTNYFKYSIIFHFSSIPLVLANGYFITYVLWRMSKVKPDYDGDESYLVIYGGEGSETKKLLDDFE